MPERGDIVEKLCVRLGRVSAVAAAGLEVLPWLAEAVLAVELEQEDPRPPCHV